jgi:hypothetical protein
MEPGDRLHEIGRAAFDASGPQMSADDTPPLAGGRSRRWRPRARRGRLPDAPLPSARAPWRARCQRVGGTFGGPDPGRQDPRREFR